MLLNFNRKKESDKSDSNQVPTLQSLLPPAFDVLLLSPPPSYSPSPLLNGCSFFSFKCSAIKSQWIDFGFCESLYMLVGTCWKQWLELQVKSVLDFSRCSVRRKRILLIFDLQICWLSEIFWGKYVLSVQCCWIPGGGDQVR